MIARRIKAHSDHAPGAQADRPIGIQQPANPAETSGSRIQPEDAESPVHTAAATIGMPQDPHERFSRLDRRRVAQGDREIVAGVFPKLMNDAIRNPDDGIEEVQDGRESLQRHDDQITATHMGQLVIARPIAVGPAVRDAVSPRGKMIVGRAIPQTAGAAMPSSSTIRIVARNSCAPT